MTTIYGTILWTYFRGGFVLPNLRPVSQNLNYSMGDTPTKTGSPMDAFSITSPDRGRDSSTSLRNELDLDADSKGATKDVGQLTDTIDVKSTSTGTSKCKIRETATPFLTAILIATA